MKLILKEDPKEWRKSALLSALGLAMLNSLLRWRGKITSPVWFGVLALLGCIAILALAYPRAFRGWYRLSTRTGFAVAQFLGRIVLALFFFLVFVPVGVVMRLAGKDSLQLRRNPNAETYWTPAKEPGPLDRPF